MEIGRRGFLHLAGSAIVACPPSAKSQQGSTLPVVAFLVPSGASVAKVRVESLRKGLQEAGLLEGTHYAIALRFADGQRDRLPQLARELHALRPAVFVAGGTFTAALDLEPRPPLVFTAIAIDPMEWGIAESYARPGGMVTGNVLNALGGEDSIAEKRISLFKELVPGLTRLGMFGQKGLFGQSATRSATISLFEKEVSAGKKASARLGFETRAYPLNTIDDLEGAIRSGLDDGIDGIYLSSDTLLFSNMSRAMPLIMAAGKPTVGAYVEFARAGVLITYATDISDGVRRAGVYAGKILQGAKPGDLPIEQPTKFTLAINAKTAKQLGIAIPPVLAASADELIE
jgi:putative ABC transport system substrate-binding protein